MWKRRPTWGSLESPAKSRKQGVRIQRLLKDEILEDAVTFDPETGLTLDSGKRVKTFTELGLWRGKRAARGAMPPHGFLKGAVFVDAPPMLEKED